MKLHKEGYMIIPWFVIGVFALFLLLTWLIPLELFRLVLGSLSAIFLVLGTFSLKSHKQRRTKSLVGSKVVKKSLLGGHLGGRVPKGTFFKWKLKHLGEILR